MKILMISDVYYPRVNGVATSILTFTRVFLQQGHTVTLIAPEYPLEHDDEFEIIRIPSWQVPLDPEDRFMHLRPIKRLLPQLQQCDYDILHIHTPFVAHYAGKWLGKKLDIPVVLSYHTFFEAYLEKYMPWLPHGLLRSFARMISRVQCNEVDGIVSPSNQMLEKLHEYGVDQLVSVIPTGLKLEQFEDDGDNRFRQQHNIPADACLILYLGRVAHEKNIEFLVNMFIHVHKRLPDARLLIAGEGPAEVSLKRKVAVEGLSDVVFFTGYLKPIKAVVDCYRASDIFVFASETETQGLVLLEAMACETPVVSCASLGSKDVLKEGKGCRIAPLDETVFADIVRSLAEDSNVRSKLAESGRSYVKDWSTEAKSAHMLDFYQQVIMEYSCDEAHLVEVDTEHRKELSSQEVKS